MLVMKKPDRSPLPFRVEGTFGEVLFLPTSFQEVGITDFL